MKEQRAGEPYWLGHRERLRHRAASEGFEALRPHEIIELVLYNAVPRVDLTEVSRALIGALGSVEGVMKADRAALLAVPGVTPRMAEWLMMTGELVDAYTAIRQENQFRIWCFKDLLSFIAPRWREVPPPQTRVIYTDYDDRLISYEALTDSLYWADPGCFREVMESALAMEAKYVYLLAFTGVEPLKLYEEEEKALKRLSEALKTIDVTLMDCVLIGEAGIVSMRLENRLDPEDTSPGAARLRERYGSDGEDM